MARQFDIGPVRRFAQNVAKAQGVDPLHVTSFNLRINGSGETVLSLDMIPTHEVLALLDPDQQEEVSADG